MNLVTLNNYMELKIKRAKALEMIDSLRQAASLKSPRLTGMPHGSGISDKVGDLAIELEDLGSRIDYYDEQIAEITPSVNKFIEGISNDKTRVVFRLRFMRCLSWVEIADVLQVDNEDNVKKLCYNYFKV